MPDDLAHNPQPMPTVDYAAELEHLSAKLPDRKWRTFCRQSAAAFRQQIEDIQELQQEVDQMARDFISAVTVVTDAYNAKATENTGLKTANDTLTAQVADLSTKQQTPETLAAQQKVVDLSEQISPSQASA